MSPDRDPGRREDDIDEYDYEDESPRSIFAALWFRSLLAVLVLGVLAAVAVPYVLDFATSPALKSPAAKSPTAAPPPAAPAPATAPTVTPAAPAGAPAPAGVPAAPAVATARPASQPPSAPPASAAEPTKPPPARAPVAKAPAQVAKAVEAPKPAPKAATATKPSPVTAANGAAAGGPYWVQVGAFKEPETAKQLVSRLREQGLRAEESARVTAAPRPAVAPGAGASSDRYDVVVSGASAADIDARLAPKGMTGERTSNGTVVRPSLPLREAVGLSRELADAGLSVQVRRVGGPAPVTTPAAAPTGEVTLHRVRVGGFPDRAAAVAAVKQLEAKGFKPFITRGNE